MDEKAQHPELTGEADLLLGTARMKQAAHAEPAKAAELWAEARRRLERRKRKRCPRARPAGCNTGSASPALIPATTRPASSPASKTSVEQADDPVEGYNLLTQAYLSLPKPDLQEARKLTQATQFAPGERRSACPGPSAGRRTGIEVGRPDQARQVLKKLGPQAGPEIRAKARRLLARSYQDDGHWAEAAALWEEARADGGKPGEATTWACVRSIRKQAADAVRDWEQCVQAGGDEAPAAALALADLRLKGPNPETALEMLDVWWWTSVQPELVGQPRCLDQPAVVKAVSRTPARRISMSRLFDAAVKLAEPYSQGVAAPGDADVLRAKASSEWCASAARRPTPLDAGGETGGRGTRPATFSLQAAACLRRRGRESPRRPRARRVPPGKCPVQLGRPRAGNRRRPSLETGASDGADRRGDPTQESPGWYVQGEGEAWYLLGEVTRGAGGGANVAERAPGERGVSESASIFDAVRLPRPPPPPAKAAEARGALDEAKGRPGVET